MTTRLTNRFAHTMCLPILALALLAGCNDSSKDTVSLGTDSENETALREAGMKHAERLRAAIQPLSMLERDYAAGDISAEELYTRSRTILDEIAEDEAIAPTAIEVVGPGLLNRMLQDKNAPKEGVGYFTEMLMSIESPNADMILEALHALDGYWTEEQIRTTAHESIRNAEEWISRTDAGVRYQDRDRTAIIASVQHLQSLASL